MSKKFLKDLAERVGFSAAYAATSVLVVELGDLPYEWAPVLVAALAALKGVLAKQVGSPDTAGFAGSSSDPAPVEYVEVDEQ